VFNRNVNIDDDEIRKLPQLETDNVLGIPPNCNEVINAIKKMASEKAPGMTGHHRHAEEPSARGF
jgi:hypothetical protein